MEAMDNLEISKRLGYDDVDCYASPKQKETKPVEKPKERYTIISPTKSKKALMRQVSALGMEDPVFQTKEKNPEHPSANIFDDMGVEDMPKGMEDLLSVASDPTDDQVRGLAACSSSNSRNHNSKSTGNKHNKNHHTGPR